MFYNIGEKIQGLATFIATIGIIISIIAGVGFLAQGGAGVIIGLIIAVVGSLASWIGSFLLYGFGELISNTQQIIENTRPEVKASKPRVSDDANLCPVCGQWTIKNPCWNCKTELKFKEKKTENDITTE